MTFATPSYDICYTFTGEHDDAYKSLWDWQLIVHDYSLPPGQPISEIIAEGAASDYNEATRQALAEYRAWLLTKEGHSYRIGMP